MDIAYTVFDNKAELYEFIVKQVRRLGEETSETMSLLSNISALLKIELENVNWAGFYLLQGGRLVLGPFQGKPAVAEIAIGQGVCGTAVKEKRTQLVDDVHKCSNADWNCIRRKQRSSTARIRTGPEITNAPSLTSLAILFGKRS